MGTYWLVKNNWSYTLLMAFLLSNLIYFTKLMQTGDKAIIRSMIDVDQTIAALNVTETSFPGFLSANFGFNREVMLGKLNKHFHKFYFEGVGI